MEYFYELLNILNAMSPFLLLGFLFAGLLHAFIPKTTFSKYLSGRGFKSVFLSALFGVPLPLCSCGVIPTAMSLKKEGASDGATVSFLIATPQTGVDSILATYGVFGLPFAIIRPIIAFIVAIFGGLLVNRFSTEREPVDEQRSAAVNQTPKSKRATLADALKYGFIDMLQDLGGWLMVGLVIAAAITAFVPSSIFEILDNYYILNILVVLLISIPMYICSTGSIPIAISLLMKGISPGAALIFLMAGPATNVATLTVLRKVLGVRTTILYLFSIIIGAICFAIFIDFALPAEWFIPKLTVVDDCEQCVDVTSWWHIASSILFVALIANAYILKYCKGMTHSHSHEIEEVKEVATNRFKVNGMRCNHCKANVERAVAALPTTSSVTIDLASGIVEVVGYSSQEEVCHVIRQLGFEVEAL